MKLFGNCCRNAPGPRRPSMALVCHANCQTSRTGVSRWFYQFLSEGLAMWPAGHTFKPRLGCFRSRGCVSIKTQSASSFGLREGSPLLYYVCELNPFTHAVELVRFALYCQINWTSLAVVGGCTALFMVGAILAYDPARGFLARRGEPGGGA